MAALAVLAVAAGLGMGRVGWLTQAIALMVMVTGLGILVAPWATARLRQAGPEQQGRWLKHQSVLTMLAGATLGWVVALTSVGAGALGAVAIMALYPVRMSPQRLVGSDLAHAVPLAVVAGVGYLLMGQVDTWLLVQLLAGSVPSVVVGSIWANRAPPMLLRALLATALLLIGFLLLASGAH
jgi:uncharacterized membrane protein YfcA